MANSMREAPFLVLTPMLAGRQPDLPGPSTAPPSTTPFALPSPVSLTNDPYASIRTVSFNPVAPLTERERQRMLADASHSGGALIAMALRPKYQTSWDVFRPGGFQSKYNEITVLLDGRLAVTLQQPGMHKYDTMTAIYGQDPQTGKWMLQNDPMQAKTRQVSSSQQVRDFIEQDVLPVAALVVGGTYVLPYLAGAGAGAGAGAATSTGAAAGTSGGLSGYLGGVLGSQTAGNFAANALIQGGLGGVSAELQGGDFLQGFRRGALNGVINTGIGFLTSPILGELSQTASRAVNGGTVGNIFGNAITGASTSALQAAIRGGTSRDILRNAGAGALGGGVNAGLAGVVGMLNLPTAASRLATGVFTNAALGANRESIISGFVNQGLGEVFRHSVSFNKDYSPVADSGKECLVTISIAPPGTKTADGGDSFAGHMWLTLECPGVGGTVWSKGSVSFGYSPRSDWSGWPLAPGQVNANGRDDVYYLNAISRTFSISLSQANAIRGFGEDPFSNGLFSNVYNAITNSCVDFVWKALEIGGLNNGGFQGAILPEDNIRLMQRIDPLTGLISSGASGVPGTGAQLPPIAAQFELISSHNSISGLGGSPIRYFDTISLSALSIPSPGLVQPSSFAGNEGVFRSLGSASTNPWNQVTERWSGEVSHLA